jgi:hypothetical protein
VNGSALRHELRVEPAAGVVDPLQVLEGILGTKVQDKTRNIEGEPEGVDDDIDFGNLSLEEFADRKASLKQVNGVKQTECTSRLRR